MKKIKNKKKTLKSSAVMHFIKGGEFQKAARYFQAELEYNEAIRIEPSFVHAYINRGAAKADLKRYEEAIKDFNEAIRLDPALAAAYSNRGAAKAELKRYEEAIKDYDEAIRLDPAYAAAYNNRGIAKAGLKRYEEAIKDYDEAIRLAPALAEAYYNRGNAKAELKRYEEAIKDFNEAIRLDPADAAAYYNRGTANADLKRYEEAIKDYDEAIRLAPALAEVYNNRGTANVGLKRYEEAIKDYDEAISCKPGLPQPYLGRGISKATTGDKEGALKDLKSLLRIAGDELTELKESAKQYIEKLESATTEIPQPPETPELIISHPRDRESKAKAIMFIDLKGSTARLNKYGDENYIEMIEIVEKIFHDIAVKHNLNYEKGLGDGFLTVFKNSVDAAYVAIKLLKALDEYNSKISHDDKSEREINIRVGIDFGPTIKRIGDDRFGKTVVIAQRVEGLIKDDHFESNVDFFPEKERIFTTHIVFRDIENIEGIKGNIKLIGKAELKGLEGMDYHIYNIDWKNTTI
jgi:tetratricopeptide (TPR) repeat protein